MFDDDMEEYRAEFQAAMPGFATTFNIAGSFEGNQISDWYRSPVELGWGKNIKFDHDFIGRKALEPEVADPKRLMRTLVWNADDVVDVYASMFGAERPYDYMDMPRDQRGFTYADKVIKNGKLVGVSTSRCYSYYFRESCRSARLTPRVASREARSLSFGGIRTACKRKSAPRLRQRPTRPTTASSTFTACRRQSRSRSSRRRRRPTSKQKKRGETHAEISAASWRRARSWTLPGHRPKQIREDRVRQHIQRTDSRDGQ
jgi:hypothetical protein